jgi:hypothetical protein
MPSTQPSRFAADVRDLKTGKVTGQNILGGKLLP